MRETDVRMIAVPMTAYNEMLKNQGRIDALNDYIRENPFAGTGDILRIIGLNCLAKDVEKQMEDLMKGGSGK